MPPHWYLYAIRLPVDDYVVAYLGVTKHKLRKRLTQHSREHKPISDAIRACGRDTVIIQRLACGNRDFIYNLEVRAIAAFNTRWPNGYNLASGGFGGRDPLPSTRAKIAAASLGRKCSPETVAKRVAKTRGMKRSPETCAKIAAVRLGRKRSPESVAKTAAANRGRKQSPKEIKNRKIARREKFSPKPCAHCGKPFQPEHGVHHFCSPVCKEKHRPKRLRAAKFRGCVICGHTFRLRQWRANEQTCSEKCHQQQKKAAEREQNQRYYAEHRKRNSEHRRNVSSEKRL